MALIRYAQPGLHGDKEPEPNLSYEYIPKERYTSKEFMKLEWDHIWTVSYTHLRAHETDSYLVCRLLLEKKKE